MTAFIKNAVRINCILFHLLMSIWQHDTMCTISNVFCPTRPFNHLPKTLSACPTNILFCPDLTPISLINDKQYNCYIQCTETIEWLGHSVAWLTLNCTWNIIMIEGRMGGLQGHWFMVNAKRKFPRDKARVKLTVPYPNLPLSSLVTYMDKWLCPCHTWATIGL
jgi:hypothetical protein